MSRPLLMVLILLLGGCASRGAFFAPTNGILYHPAHLDQVGRGDGPLQLVGERLYDWEVLFTNQIQPERTVALSVEHERPQRGFWRRVGEVLNKIGI